LDNLVNLGVGSGLLLAVLGIAIVFVGLIFLIIVIVVLSKIVGLKKPAAPATKAAPAPVAAAPAPAAAAPVAAPAPAPAPRKLTGTSKGTIDIGDVHPRTAAMLMAIVADESGSPIDELDFKSIKEVDGEKSEGK